MTQRKDSIDLNGATLLIIFSALLGFNQVCIKLVNDGLNPVFQAGLRSACAFVVVLAFALLTKKKLSISDGTLLPGLITGLLFSLEFVMLFQALDYIDVSRASVLFYTMPFWVTVLAHWLIPGDRITALKSVGLLLALAGIAITLGSKQQAYAATPEALLGDVYCLLAAAAWALIAIIVRTTKLKSSNPEMQLLYQLAVSAPVLLLLALAGGEMLREPTILIWSIFAFQVIVVVSIGFLSWFWVLSIYPVSNMAVFSFLAPVFGVLFGWLILRETITPSIVFALSFIAIGIALVNWPANQPRQTSAG